MFIIPISEWVVNGTSCLVVGQLEAVRGEPFDQPVCPEPIEGEWAGSGQACRTMEMKFFYAGDNLRFSPRIEAGKKLAEGRGGAEGHLEAFKMGQKFCPTFEAFQPLARFQTFLIPVSHPADGLVAQAFARRQFQYPWQCLEQLLSFVPIQGSSFFDDFFYGGGHAFSLSAAQPLYHLYHRGGPYFQVVDKA